MAQILIVDDEPDTALLLSHLMRCEGHSTSTASNVWEGLLALVDTHFDLILLDIMMPGLDGAKFIQILRKSMKDGNVPVVVVTALDLDAAEQQIDGSHVEGIVI